MPTLSLLLLTLACGRSVEDQPAPQEPVQVQAAPSTPEPDAAPAVELRDEVQPPAMPQDRSVPVPVVDKEDAVKRACARLIDCDCSDGQVYDDCVQSAMQADLPAKIYRCIASRPCESLCVELPGGTHDKGMSDCVNPYLEETIGRGQGLKKLK